MRSTQCTDEEWQKTNVMKGTKKEQRCASEATLVIYRTCFVVFSVEASLSYSLVQRILAFEDSIVYTTTKKLTNEAQGEKTKFIVGCSFLVHDNNRLLFSAKQTKAAATYRLEITRDASNLTLLQPIPLHSSTTPLGHDTKMCLYTINTYDKRSHALTEAVLCEYKSDHPFPHTATSTCHTVEETRILPSRPFCVTCRQVRQMPSRKTPSRQTPKPTIAARLVSAVDKLLGNELRAKPRKAAPPKTTVIRTANPPVRIAQTKPLPKLPEPIPHPSRDVAKPRAKATDWGAGIREKESFLSFSVDEDAETLFTRAGNAAVDRRTKRPARPAPDEEQDLVTRTGKAAQAKRLSRPESVSKPSDSPSHLSTSDPHKVIPALLLITKPRSSPKKDDRKPLWEAAPDSNNTSPLLLRIQKPIKRKPVPPPLPKPTPPELHFDPENKPQEIGLKRQPTKELPRSLVAGGAARAQAQKAAGWARASISHYDFKPHDETGLPGATPAELAADSLEDRSIAKLLSELEANAHLGEHTSLTLPNPAYDGSSYRSSWGIIGLPDQWDYVD